MKIKFIYRFLSLLSMVVLISSCSLVNFDYDTTTTGQFNKVTFCPNDATRFMPASMKENMNNQMNSMMSSSFDDVIAKVKKQDTWPAESVKIIKFSLEQTNIPSSLDSSDTLGFISTVKIYISYEDDSNEILFASTENQDTKATKIIFKMENKNIVDYIDKGFKIRVDSTIRDCPSIDILIKGKITANINL